MSYIIDISTAVPEFTIEKNDLERFYSDISPHDDKGYFIKKLSFLNRKMAIDRRHSCIPDYNGSIFELYKNGNYEASVTDRMDIYKSKILPFASRAIDKVFLSSKVNAAEITHLITVSCTGLFAPGMEFLISEKYGFNNIEKWAINFSGCYAAMKALKQANHIAKAEPDACVLIVCAELCSLHFYPSFTDEDLVANLLFSDGAAAAIICGEQNKHVKDRVCLQINDTGTGIVPNTADVMTWNISSSAFRMFLGKEVVNAIRENVEEVIRNFLKDKSDSITHWAIHPGGVKIVEAVQQAMDLERVQVAESFDILKNYGNMSSPTILFILSKMLNDLKCNSSTSAGKK
ncbi:MAG: type III polyketide synthase, partial [Bacteroidia bacterium]